MKIELEINDIERIVQGVVEQLTPLLKQNPKSNDNELMTVDEVTKYLKVTKSFIYDKVHKKEIPFHKIGKFPRFKKKHIDLWIVNPYHPDLDNYNLNHKEGR